MIPHLHMENVSMWDDESRAWDPRGRVQEGCGRMERNERIKRREEDQRREAWEGGAKGQRRSWSLGGDEKQRTTETWQEASRPHVPVRRTDGRTDVCWGMTDSLVNFTSTCDYQIYNKLPQRQSSITIRHTLFPNNMHSSFFNDYY